MTSTLAQEVARLRREVEQIKRGQRLAHGAAIDNAAVEVRDGAGSLRAIVGQQGDGTSGVQVVNGGPPPAPSTPTVAPALGGIAVGWDGDFAGGAVMPLDWNRVEVHASPTDGFTPDAGTLQATVETPQGAITYLPATTPQYVRLLARNTSGTASTPTGQSGPYAPRPVAGDIGIGEITATLIADGAVTTPKLFANAVTTAKLEAGSVDAVALKADAITGKVITGGEVNGAVVTGGVLQTGTTGQRITINEFGANGILLYNVDGLAIGTLSPLGLVLKGTSGAVMRMQPNATYPNLSLTNSADTNSAIINVVESSPGDANLGLNSGEFTADGYNDMKWRTFFGKDFWTAERVRTSALLTPLGGRVFLDSAGASIGYRSGTNYHLATADVDKIRFHNQTRTTLSVSAGGVLSTPSIVTGSVNITPSAANTPSGVTISGLNLPGTVHRAFVTAQSGVPGTVLECTANNVTAGGLTVWVSRTNTTATNIWYLIICSD